MILKRIISVSIVIGIALFIMGNLFKIMHWPKSKPILISAYALILLVYPFLIYIKKKVSLLDIFMVIGVFVWCGFAIINYIYQLESRSIYFAISKVGFVLWAGVALHVYYNSPSYQLKSKIEPIKIVYFIALVSFATGIFLKTLHYPKAEFLLITGALVMTVSFFLVDFFKPN